MTWKLQGEKHSLLFIWSLLLALSRKSLISSNKSFKTNLVIWEKKSFQIYSTYWKVDYQYCRTVWRLSFRKQLLLFHAPKMKLENAIGTAALLGIFAYICRQRPIIHWWRWRSGAPAAWHHWCGRSQNLTGINWIPIECSSERNIFDGTPENFLSKEGVSKIFHSSKIVSGNSYGVWVDLLLLEGRIVPSCQLP